MHIFWEVVLVAIGLGLALWMLKRSLRSAAAVVALLAWLPLWLFTRILWHPLTGHHSPLGFPWWFWLVFGIGILALVISLIPGIKLFAVVRLAGVALVVIALATINWFAPVGSHHHKAASKPKSSSSTSAPAASSAACTTWKMQDTTPSNGKWAGQGVPSIATAKTNAEAQKAATDWISGTPRTSSTPATPGVKDYPGEIAGASAYLLHQTVDPATFVDSHGCATAAAVSKVNELAVAVALAAVTPSEAPANGINTLTSNGKAYAESQAGVTGDRKAIEIVAKDGTTFWVMARCGNPVTVGKAPIPSKPAPTPTPTPTPSCPPGQHISPQDHTTCILPKDPSKDVLVNPSVPAQVKGPGTTKVGQDPGPATKPIDGGTGCGGPCPGSTASAKPTTGSEDDAPPVVQPAPTPIATDPPASTPIVAPPPPAS